jgi:hypothetical protein
VAPKFGGLVDAENRVVSRRNFMELQIYAQELERVLARCGLFLCHDSQIRQPSDIAAILHGRTPGYWWCATAPGEFHAFLNICCHRGTGCRADSTAAAASISAYRGWIYNNDGRPTGPQISGKSNTAIYSETPAVDIYSIANGDANGCFHVISRFLAWRCVTTTPRCPFAISVHSGCAGDAAVMLPESCRRYVEETMAISITKDIEPCAPTGTDRNVRRNRRRCAGTR